MIRPLRGRAVLRKHQEDCGGEYMIGRIVVPANVDPHRTDRDKQFGDRSKRKIHRGVVLALGKPAFEHTGIERPWTIEVGDEVLYTYAVALARARSFEDIVIVAQEEIQAVLT
jgi:co-chaperonin GroES (HSP10)